MRNSTKEIIKLTSKELLMTIFDLTAEIVGMNYYYRKGVQKYLIKRKFKKEEVAERFRYLKRMGYIETFVKKNNRYVRVTNKGTKHLEDLKIEDLKIERPKKWDGKWRVVIFDVPEDKKERRNAFRGKLRALGFEIIQKSVYVYPFECSNEIEFLKNYTSTSNNVIIMISEIIEGEEEIMHRFLEKGVLTRTDIK